ncbi:MAG TPA: Ig-like domain-containing protein, partial [Gaiellaceae bacterium]|nr:Ig-like domain-containing protein [Gaiellaceae bacterium]
MRRIATAALFVIAAVLVHPGVGLATVKVGQPFPTNLYTVRDHTQATGLRVNLPKPDCAVRPSDCADIDVLNQLDGFNIQPRISIPFSGPIDVSTVSSSTVFLVGPHFNRVGIDQIVWEQATNTLHAETDEQLRAATTYLLVVTRGIRGPDGKRIKAGAVSLFTTQSIRSISRKIRRQLRKVEPSFVLGSGGERTVFPLSTVSSITWQRQISTAPTFSTGGLFLPLLAGVGTVAFGSYESPDYQNAAKVIPAVGTRTGNPRPQGTNDVQFSLFLPTASPPDGGWPVAILGHAFTDWKNGAPPVLAGTFARSGIATIAINVVGHGGGPLGTYTVNRTGLPSVTLPLGGRGIDQDGNGSIDSTEGVNAAPPYTLISNRDGLRQTVIDLMQLVKVLRGGVDVDADGADDLSTSRIYYAGQSFGGMYGTQLLGLERNLRAGVLNVPGGPVIEIARLSPSFRGLVGLLLLMRTPSLYNAVPNLT